MGIRDHSVMLDITRWRVNNQTFSSTFDVGDLFRLSSCFNGTVVSNLGFGFFFVEELHVLLVCCLACLFLCLTLCLSSSGGPYQLDEIIFRDCCGGQLCHI